MEPLCWKQSPTGSTISYNGYYEFAIAYVQIKKKLKGEPKRIKD